MEGRLDDLIVEGWYVIYSDVDPFALHQWRCRAFDCLSEMLGPDHVYTRHFENLVRQGSKRDLLTTGGILSAARQAITCTRVEERGVQGTLQCVSRRTEEIRRTYG
ncbi:hypothetical protein ACFL2Q_15560 [Thermodesulfobacteriota bacterium]